MKHLPKKTMSALWCATIAGALPIAFTAPASAQTAPPKAAKSTPSASTEVAATVNGEKIMMTKVDLVLNRIKTRNPDVPQADLDAMRSDIIEDLIAERLLIQKAKTDKLLPNKKELDDAMWKLEKAFPSKSAFDKYLADNNKTQADLRVAIAENMAAETLSLNLTADLTATDEEIKKFYDEHKAEFVVPERVRVRHIQVSFPVELNKEGKFVFKELTAAEKKAFQQKAQGILKKASAEGANFALLAKENSGDKVSARRGGDLGFISRDDIVDKAFGDVVFSTPAGKVHSKLVETKFGYNIVKVETKQASRTRTLTEVTPEIKLYILQRETKKRMDAEVAKLRKDATVSSPFLKKTS